MIAKSKIKMEIIKSNIRYYYSKLFTKTSDVIPVQLASRIFHFSLDDCNFFVQQLKNNKLNSIFETKTLEILKEWHDQYGIVVSLYLQEDLSFLNKYIDEFNKNANWLRISYHGIGDKKRGIDNFFYSAQNLKLNNLDYVPRLDYFHASLLNCKLLKKHGCLGFLGCDDWSYNKEKRKSNYYLKNSQNELLDRVKIIYDKDHSLYFFKTDFRLEQINQRWGSSYGAIKFIQQNKFNENCIIFSHESIFDKFSKEAEELFKWAIKDGYIFDFPMNLIK